MKDIVERKDYFVFYDKVAMVYGEPFAAKTTAEALRAFHLSMSQQRQKGMISDPEDYELYRVARFITYDDGSLEVIAAIDKIYDNEENNKE